MMDIIIWNIRGMKYKGATERLKNLINKYNVEIVAIQEPFLPNDHLDEYKCILGMDSAICNVNGKNFFFWKNDYKCEVIFNQKQQISMKCRKTGEVNTFWISAVYAKSTSARRRKLWRNLEDMSNTISGPWAVLGDFNAILAPEEKKGGKPHRLSKSLDFIYCLEDCNLQDAGYTGNTFTWCNGRRKGKRISKRLDRVLVNDCWLDTFQNTRIDDKSKTGSDHRVLLMRNYNNNQEIIKYFKFLNFWIHQPGYKELVEDSWRQAVQGNAQWVLQQKLKTVSKKLSFWSRHTIGNVFDKVQQMEKYTNGMENIFEQDDSDMNRENIHKAQAEYIQWLKKEDSILKQRAMINWADEGDTNSKYFHSVIR